MVQNFWTLALLLGLMKTRLNFFHIRTKLNHLPMAETQTLGTWGQSFVFVPASKNFTITPHPPLHGPQSAFLTTLWQDPISISNINIQFSSY